MSILDLLTPKNVKRGVNLLQSNRGIVDALAHNLTFLPASARAFAQNIAGAKTPIDESYFSENQLAEIKNRTAKQMANRSMKYRPDDEYGFYDSLQDKNRVVPYDPDTTISMSGIFKDPKEDIQATLGMYTYKENPDGTISAIDKHDFDFIEGGSKIYGEGEKNLTIGQPKYKGYTDLPFLEPLEYPATPGSFVGYGTDDKGFNLVAPAGPANMYQPYFPGGEPMSPLAGKFIEGDPAYSRTKFEEIYSSQEEVLQEAIDAYKNGEINGSKLMRIVGGMYGLQGQDLTPKHPYAEFMTTGQDRMRESLDTGFIPVNINLGRISQLDKLKANPNFARYTATHKDIPSQIKKQAEKERDFAWEKKEKMRQQVQAADDRADKQNIQKDLQQMRGPIGRNDPPPSKSQNVARTSSRVDSSGNVKAYGLKEGGRVGYALGSPEPLEISDREKRIAFNLYERLKDIEEQYTGERIVGDPSPLNLDPSDRQQGTLMADATTEMDQAPDSFLRPRRYDIIEGKELPAETLEDFDVMFRKPNATGGRVLLGEGTKTKLVQFVENFIAKNNRPPTIMEIAEGAKSSTASIKKYLKEGKDFTVASKLEAAMLGGKKPTGITKVDPKLVKELKDLKVKGISLSVETNPTKTGSKSFRVFFDKKLNLKNISVPATEENLKKIKTTVSEVIDSDNYNKNILPFQTTEDQRKIRRLKEANYKKKDPYRIYKALQKYKTEKFPGSLSKDVVIQHGQPKFTTQTLSKFALIPSTVNISDTVEKVERLRNNALKIALATLNNKNADVATKKAAAEKYNSIAKGLRGQLKGEASGVVNFELLEVDDKGNFKKIKDIGFDSTKALVASDKDLSKITKLEAEELIKAGKKKIDIEALKLTTDVKPLSKIARPEKALVRESFKRLSKPGIMGALKASRFLPVVGAIATPALAAYGLYDAYKKGYTRPDELLASAAFGSGVSLKDKIKYAKSKELEDKDGLASLMA